MTQPGRVDIDSDHLQDLLHRVEQHQLYDEDYPLLGDLVRSMTWLSQKLENQELTIRILKKLFGVGKTTEKTNNLPDALTNTTEGDAGAGSSDEENNPSDKTGGRDTADKDKKDRRKNRKGNRPSANDFKNATVIKIFHKSLQSGSRCPECDSGNLRALYPGKVLRIIGQPWLQAYIYEQERFRCNTCGKTFTASLPPEVVGAPKYDTTANAIVSLLKYRGGFPFYRQESLQKMLETPISDSTLWEMTHNVAKSLAPVFEELIQEAARGKCLHNDDTKARILDLIQENKSRDGTKERTGIFTSAILSCLQDSKQVALFFTGRKHAGENLSEVLNERPKELSIPIQMCDASSNNSPKSHKTDEANCLAHLRRKFYEIAEIWPSYVLPIIAYLNNLFRHEREANEKTLDDKARLKWHQTHSAPVMRELKAYSGGLIKDKKTEPNSNLGKAIAYMNNHWDAFTLFLRRPGVPLDNNADERLMKRAVLNRKNGLFFKSEYGAWVADVLLSCIETCNLNGVNPYNYLVAIQENSAKVEESPEQWLPWNYAETVSGLGQPPP